jgi:hypothetical protein
MICVDRAILFSTIPGTRTPKSRLPLAHIYPLANFVEKSRTLIKIIFIKNPRPEMNRALTVP